MTRTNFASRVLISALFASILYLDYARAEDFLFTDAEADCAAQMIFMNECSAEEQNLIYWSPEEAFPSLGIGHFIWYSENAYGPYLESFSGFLEFAREIELAVPAWIGEIAGQHSPWLTREIFQKDLNSDRMRELREFLSRTKREQAHYIIRRFMRVFPQILDDLHEADRQPVQKKYNLLIMRREAIFAMIDYVNFKGEGLRIDARYDSVGWGLAQVLIEMKEPDDPAKALDEFILAAQRVLERRVKHSPKPEVESKWLPGWKNRVKSYSRIRC